ncbi:hypothetical protein V8E54_010349 [Elaphomyces granulatus]|jgi:hypothetical protein
MHFHKTSVLFFAALFTNGMANPVSKPENIIESRGLLTCLIGNLFLNIPIISADNQSCDSGSAYCCTSSGASQSCDLSTTGQCSSNLICCNTGDGANICVGNVINAPISVLNFNN